MSSHADAASAAPIEVPPAHTDAYMDMDYHRSTWDDFGKFTVWSCMILFITLGYAIFTLAMGIPWIGAMIGFAAFGIIGGLLMNMGGAWIATVVGLCVVGLFLQLLIALGSALF